MCATRSTTIPPAELKSKAKIRFLSLDMETELNATHSMYRQAKTGHLQAHASSLPCMKHLVILRELYQWDETPLQRHNSIFFARMLLHILFYGWTALICTHLTFLNQSYRQGKQFYSWFFLD